MKRKQIIHIIEWAIALAACGYLVWWLATYDDYVSLLAGLRAMNTAQWCALIASVLLMPVNMTIEAWRWRTLMNEGESRVESQDVIGWAEAHRQVYYSKLAGLITPWRLGEYPARGLLMQKNSLSQEKEQVSSKTLWTKVLTMGAVGSATMTIAIVIGGLIGLAVVGSPVNLGDNYIIILLGVLVGAILLIAAGWKIRTVMLSSYSSPSVDRRLTVGMVCKNVLQSMVRLLCWCVQLGLLLYALDGIAGMTGIAGDTALTEITEITRLTGLAALTEITGLTAIYYLLVTITPNVPIAEIGVRGAWAIAVFGTPQAAMAAVVLWVINTLLPCVGWLFLRKKAIKFA
ncbi:MAG: hypothetical protein U0K81_02885, partial [Paludibacteraceae bacterium]|nr:hypothetical protein [Paludibacteraceae bacterium]